jgi:ABC-2 type transport system permease protein
MSISNSTRGVLFRFGFRQALKGAIIVGLIAGGQLLLQGVAYQKAYGTNAKQQELAASLANAPGLGFIYGDSHTLTYGTQGYMAYRVLVFMGVVVAAWALMTMTKMLRGAEEDGRYEVIRTGATTPRKAAGYLTLGFAGAWWVALLISYLLTLLATKAGGFTTTASAMWLLNIGIFLPGLLFAGVGVLTSQLGLTRGRAMLYGIVPLAALFLLRGVGNISHDLHPLLYYTPFGWAQLLSPVHDPSLVWLYVPALLAIVFAVFGVRLAARDYGSSIIQASTTVRSRFAFLGNAWALALRQNFWVLVGWGLGALVMIGMISGLANTAVGALDAAGDLSKAVTKLGGTGNLKVAFVSAGMLFMVMVLLMLSITIVGQIRRDEAKQYLDNILVAPQKRTTWLLQRLLLGLGTVLVISLLGGVLVQVIAGLEHISLSFGKVLATSVCVVGSVAFLMGVGTLLYGMLPRLTVLAMYAVITWSFVITLVASAAKLNTALLHSSLFYYTNFNLAQWPNWATFGWFVTLGAAFSAVGIWAFARRDIVPE